MTTPLHHHLPTLTLTCGQADRINLIETADEEASRTIEGVTSVEYANFPAAYWLNLERPACRAVSTVTVDFKKFTDRTFWTVFQQRKDVAVAVSKYVRGTPYVNGYARYPMPIMDGFKEDLEATEKRLFTNLTSLAQRLATTSKEEFGIELEEEGSSAASASFTVPQNRIDSLLTKMYQTALDLIGAANEKGTSISAKKLAGRVLAYCADIEQTLVESKKREWADRFHLLLLDLSPLNNEANTTRRELFLENWQGVKQYQKEGEKLLAENTPPDFYLKFGEERIGVHKDFFQKAVATYESSQQNIVTRYMALTAHESKEALLAVKPDEIDLTCTLLDPEDGKKLLPLLRDYFYTTEMRCDSDLIPSLYALSRYLGFPNLERIAALNLFGMERFKARVERAIVDIEAVAAELIEMPTDDLNGLAEKVSGVMHGRMQRILSAGVPVEELLSLLKLDRFLNDNSYSPIHY